MRRWWVVIVAAGMAALWLGLPHAPVSTAAATQPAADTSVRAVVANIRLTMASDGQNGWQHRRELLVHTVLRLNPDVMGFQEVSPAQGAYLAKSLTGYTNAVASGNDPGILGLAGDALSSLLQVYYRSDRFTLTDSSAGLLRPDAIQKDLTENGFFLLAILADKRDPSAPLIVVDTHLRHGMDNAAVCASKIRTIVQANQKLYPNAVVIVMGDMNHDRTSKVWTTFTAGEDGLVDSFDYSAKKPEELWGTYHAFTGKARGKWPSDLIFTAANRVADPAVIDRSHDDAGRYPSDHFFVWTTIRKK